MDEQKKPPEPGIYEGVPFSTYLAWPYASNSQLTQLLRSPAHLKAYREQPPKETAALKAGRAIHAAVLEPELFAREYVTGGRCIATTSKGAQCSRNGSVALLGGEGTVCAQHSDPDEVDHDVLVLSDADYAMCLSVRDTLLAHPTAGRLLAAPGQAELSIVWDDPATGVRCKARLDRSIPGLAGGTIVDLKSAKDARPHKFERAIVDYGYHRQGLFYLTGAREVGIPARHYVPVAVEKDAPFGIMVYRLSEDALGGIPGPGEEAFHVAKQIRSLLTLYDQCVRTDTWPCYPTDIRDVALPEWAWSAMDAQTQAIEEATEEEELEAA